MTVDGLSAGELALALRTSDPPVFTRIRNDRVLMDFRTVLAAEDREILQALTRICPDR